MLCEPCPCVVLCGVSVDASTRADRRRVVDVDQLSDVGTGEQQQDQARNANMDQDQDQERGGSVGTSRAVTPRRCPGAGKA